MRKKDQPDIPAIKKTVDKTPHTPLSYHQLGVKYYKQNLFAKAKEAWEKAISLDPEYMDARAGLGLSYMHTKQFQVAKNILEQGLKHHPDHIPSLINLALAWHEEDHFGKTSELYEKILKLDNKNQNALYGYGKLLYQTGNYLESINYLKILITENPAFFQAIYLLGCAYQDSHTNQEAIDCFKTILGMNPDYVLAYYNLGKIYQAKGQLSVAEDFYKKAIKIKPNFSEVYASLGGLYLDMADTKNAHTMFMKALKQSNNDLKILSVFLYFLNFRPQYENNKTFNYHKEWGNNISSKISMFSNNFHDYTPYRQINIGYVSPDFREHSVIYFIYPVLLNHDSERFKIFIYSNVQKKDNQTNKIKSLCHIFRDIRGMSGKTAAKQIQNDKIDILVDLAGHTHNHRLDIFAFKPAPIQVTYLGYPNTTGLKQIDYRFTDHIADPIEKQTDYTENIYRLAPPFVCYNPPENIPDISSLPYSYNHYITFGSFNYLGKINHQVIQAWAAIMKKVPDSRLFLKSRPLHDPFPKKRIFQLFQKEGIDETRIQLKGHVGSYFEHLSQYNMIDIALDPFPYNGTTTTCEALLMGVPVLTIEGSNHAGRVGKSLLYSIGLKDWVAQNETDLLLKAYALAGSEKMLIDIRSQLRNILLNADLCNQKVQTNKIEDAFIWLWQKRCKTHIKN
ncbi:O-linked N-acetylglucosamine transferase, SPINDLY family [Candidatus Magnetomorum sp. HK-1]|nr:O-linked N-acetylglucosamine transferase, SPINDLY family [Candidatus Magnetomorum sp. HK-1]